ncbi:MAG: cytochrome c1, partial [Rhodospirillaceae bacterium]|nr:cytochrome c1 [Rhodospirillaceae bacterium]
MANALTRAGLAGLALSVGLGMAGLAHAAEGAAEPPAQEWSFNGFFGTFDRASAQRGFQVYREVCSTCHSLRLLSYRDLEGLGYSEEEVAAVAAEYRVTDGPNDEGEMFERAGIAADRFVSPYDNEQAAR